MKDENKVILPNVTNIKTQETFTLPSKGLLYNESDNIPASITLRRMTTKEDKMRIRNSSEDKIRRDILQACIMEPNINAGNLKLMDANFLLFKLRIISLINDKYKIQCRCSNPQCNTIFVHEINLNEVPMEYMTKNKLKDMSFELPFSKLKIDLKYPSLNDMILMGEKLRDYFERFPNVDKAEAIYTTSMMVYIDKVNGQKLLSEELEDFVDNLDIIDFKFLRLHTNIIDDSYGFVTALKTECPNCKKEVLHGLPITDELFDPS